MQYIQSDPSTIKKLNTVAYLASAIVLLFVSFMRQIPRLNFGIDLNFLPAVYAVINAVTAVCLVIAFVHIMNKRVESHKRMVTISLALSSLFLVLYILYHVTCNEVKYCGVGASRSIYFFLLVTHIVLAATSFPFILFTFVRGYTMQIARHKAMSKYVFWVWLYVVSTGPIIYLMIRPCM